MPCTFAPINDLDQGAVPSVDEYASTQTVHQLISIVTVRRCRDDPRAPSLETYEDREGERRWMLVGANREDVGASSGASQPNSQADASARRALPWVTSVL
jgi:hypothetical protein